MLKKLQKRNSEGFTIIEVMIVLAIAALILLIVLLAVPALQRNSRNTQRKDEASQIFSSISTYVNNNNGTLPTSDKLATAITDAKLNFYSSDHVYYGSSSNIPTSATNGGNGSATVLTTEDVIYVSGAKCNGNTATNDGASSRSYVVLYAVEGANSATPQCAGS